MQIPLVWFFHSFLLKPPFYDTDLPEVRGDLVVEAAAARQTDGRQPQAERDREPQVRAEGEQEPNRGAGETQQRRQGPDPFSHR